MLQRGNTIPHFDVTRVHGEPFSYSTIWQRRNLVLITLPVLDTPPDNSHIKGFTSRAEEFTAQNAELCITRDRIAELPAPGVLVADRRGEIIHVETTASVTGLPSAQELLDWLAYVQMRCPECEGEAR